MVEANRRNRRAVVAAAAALSLAVVSGRAAAQTTPIRFGLTPVFLDSDLELLRELETYLTTAIGSPVQLVKRRTYQEVTALLLSGQLDAAWICGYPYVQNRDRLALLSVPLHRGRPLYQSYLIAEAGTEAEGLDDLRGLSHAFSDPDSNSGFLVTRWLLAQRGERPEGFFARSFFTYGHRNVIRAVGVGLAQSGSVDGYVWEVMAEREPHLTDAARILSRSDWHGFPPVCCLASGRDGRTARAMSVALENMAHTPAGVRILGILRLDGWVSGDPEWFDGIARMSAEVRRSPP